MGTETMSVGRANPDEVTVVRAGGLAALTLGMSYVLITALYAVSGAVPDGGGEAWLDYLDGSTAAWWGIVGLSVLTDVLFIPVALALYVALRAVDRDLMLAGVGFLGLFVVLDLAVTWPNYAALIGLSGDWAAATDGAQQAAYIAAAEYPSTVLASTLWAAYAILVPALGILAIGLVMLKGAFGRVTAYIGVATGILGIASVVGPLFWSPLGALAILTSILTTLWLLLVGYRLVTLSRPQT